MPVRRGRQRCLRYAARLSLADTQPKLPAVSRTFTVDLWDCGKNSINDNVENAAGKHIDSNLGQPCLLKSAHLGDIQLTVDEAFEFILIDLVTGKLLVPPLQIGLGLSQKIPDISEGLLCVLLKELFGKRSTLLLDGLQDIVEVDHRLFHLGWLKLSAFKLDDLIESISYLNLFLSDKR
jgi:hypothetical protein